MDSCLQASEHQSAPQSAIRSLMVGFLANEEAGDTNPSHKDNVGLKSQVALLLLKLSKLQKCKAPQTGHDSNKVVVILDASWKGSLAFSSVHFSRKGADRDPSTRHFQFSLSDWQTDMRSICATVWFQTPSLYQTFSASTALE